MGNDGSETDNIKDGPFDDAPERARVRLAVERVGLIWIIISPIHAVRVNWKAWVIIAAGIAFFARADIQAILSQVLGK